MTEVFLIKARDPDGTWLELPWCAKIIPRWGDDLILPDYMGDQEVSVDDVVLYGDGRVVVWLDDFRGWEDGSVSELFRHAAESEIGQMAAACTTGDIVLLEPVERTYLASLIRKDHHQQSIEPNWATRHMLNKLGR